ncbi:MAG TPA: hypothetical protein VG838_08460 [Opitutaceae bacterium]|nr:hypothetical protein [Opitutaceae bacterium]
MDIATLAFLMISGAIAAKYYPDVPENLAHLWKVLGVLVLALSLAAKIVMFGSGAPIFPSRSAASFSSVLRRQGRISDRVLVWFDLRLVLRSLGLSLIAFILALRSPHRQAQDWTAAVLLLISAGIIGVNLLKARAQFPAVDDSLLGSVRLQIAQTRYRIRSASIIWYFIIPFGVGVVLLFQNVSIFKGVGPFPALAVSPPLAFALPLLVAAIVWRAQFRLNRGMKIRARERLGQLEQLLVELSEESKSNRGEALSS